MPAERQRALLLFKSGMIARSDFCGRMWENRNFNYCNESFWRGIESAAFVWSQQELILASSYMVIHHQLNNTVCGGEYDKKHRESENEMESETRGDTA